MNDPFFVHLAIVSSCVPSRDTFVTFSRFESEVEHSILILDPRPGPGPALSMLRYLLMKSRAICSRKTHCGRDNNPADASSHAASRSSRLRGFLAEVAIENTTSVGTNELSEPTIVNFGSFRRKSSKEDFVYLFYIFICRDKHSRRI